MAFTRLKNVHGHYYASLVESYRNEQGKVRQRILQNYGRVERGLFRRLFRRKPSQLELDRTVHRVENAQNDA